MILAPQLGTAKLMSGQVVEGTRAAIEVAAREPDCQLIPVISLCVAEHGDARGAAAQARWQCRGGAGARAGLRHQFAPRGQGCGDGRAAEEAGRPRCQARTTHVVLLGEVFPADPLAIERCCGALASRPRHVAGALDRGYPAGRSGGALAPLHPFYKRPQTYSFVECAGGRRRAGGHQRIVAWLKTLRVDARLDPAKVKQVAEDERDRAQALVECANLFPAACS